MRSRLSVQSVTRSSNNTVQYSIHFRRKSYWKVSTFFTLSYTRTPTRLGGAAPKPSTFFKIFITDFWKKKLKKISSGGGINDWVVGGNLFERSICKRRLLLQTTTETARRTTTRLQKPTTTPPLHLRLLKLYDHSRLKQRVARDEEHSPRPQRKSDTWHKKKGDNNNSNSNNISGSELTRWQSVYHTNLDGCFNYAVTLCVQLMRSPTISSQGGICGKKQCKLRKQLRKKGGKLRKNWFSLYHWRTIPLSHSPYKYHPVNSLMQFLLETSNILAHVFYCVINLLARNCAHFFRQLFRAIFGPLKVSEILL